jgi:hypothetical protein
MTTSSNTEAHKLGSEGDPIRQGLFACEPIKELLRRVKLDGMPGPFQSIADATKLAGEGKKEEAKSCLRSVLALPMLETRTQLWVWSGLRELGEQPDPQPAWEILGVVFELPVQGAYDTLAAYQDGSARYLNFSGRAIFWDAPDETIKTLCQALLASTVPAASRAVPRASVSLPNSGMHATFLTRSGMFVIPNPRQLVVDAATSLMKELIRRARAAQGQ